MRTEEDFAKVYSRLAFVGWGKAKRKVKEAINVLNLHSRVHYDEANDVLVGFSNDIERVWERMKQAS